VNRRIRNKALKRRRVQLDRLPPKIASGITEGASAKEALAEHPTPSDSGAKMQAALAEVPRVNRVPVFRAVLKDSLDSVWIDEPTGRKQRDAVIMVNPEVRDALRGGWLCLRCWEPQDEAFPPLERQVHLPGCTYDIAGRQAIDVRMEFRGDEHVGPALPISVYLEEQEERARRRRDGLD
jgi:hypothetical protein